ncbi:glycosyltransferase family 4 protein [Kosmotoga pacifica]|uniref:Glycosyl transferase family 1 domain-containing protein n=1 Tax=Kosmotoga pacifica TaxID=1330330 RepID=A0A0G2ZCX6_9BACT|nr:glycosyltransferase family 4 protein [Kosmotoga pacifica]AKI96623.1 hypothetical protein IX53_00950 [Kosmotoga pacifica]
MKIAIVSPYVSETGGRERVVAEIIDELGKYHDLEIYLIYGKSYIDISHRFPDIIPKKIPMITGNPFVEAISFYFSLSTYLLFAKFDLYLFHWYYLFAKGKSVYVAHGAHTMAVREIEKGKYLRKRIRRVLRHLYPIPTLLEFLTLKTFRKKKKIIAVSDLIRQEIVRTYDYRIDEIDVIYNPIILPNIKIDFEYRNTARHILTKEFPIPFDSVVIGTVANRLSGKNVDLIIKAIELLNNNNIYVLIVGMLNKKNQKRLNDWLRRSNISKRVYLVSAYGDDIYKYYAAMDLAVFPTAYDSFGLAFIEALFAGTPAVTSSMMGALEILPKHIVNKYVFVVDELYKENLARTINTALDSVMKLTDTEREKMVNYIRKAIQENNYNSLKSYSELCQKL